MSSSSWWATHAWTSRRSRWGHPGGRVVLIGAAIEPFSVRAADIFWRELSVLGSRGFVPDDIRDAIDLYLEGTLDVRHLVERVRPLRGGQRGPRRPRRGTRLPERARPLTITPQAMSRIRGRLRPMVTGSQQAWPGDTIVRHRTTSRRRSSRGQDHPVPLVRRRPRAGARLLCLGVRARPYRRHLALRRRCARARYGDVRELRARGPGIHRPQRRSWPRVHRRHLVLRPGRYPGRDRPALESTHRGRRRAGTVRLAQGPVRAVVAGHPSRRSPSCSATPIPDVPVGRWPPCSRCASSTSPRCRPPPTTRDRQMALSRASVASVSVDAQ